MSDHQPELTLEQYRAAMDKLSHDVSADQLADILSVTETPDDARRIADNVRALVARPAFPVVVVENWDDESARERARIAVRRAAQSEASHDD